MTDFWINKKISIVCCFEALIATDSKWHVIFDFLHFYK